MDGTINVTVVSTEARMPFEEGAPIEYSGDVREYPEIMRGNKVNGI
jgi:hypothetical protein